MAKKSSLFTIENGVVEIKRIHVGLSKEDLMRVSMEQGFTLVDNQSSPSVFEGNIGNLGICSLRIWEADNKVGAIVIRTEREFTEEEALTVFEQVKNDLHADPGFDYNGYGIAPKPHEIDHFWDLDKGLVTMQWDGFNTHGFSFRSDNGRDHITLHLQEAVVKDEAYWRSEVD